MNFAEKNLRVLVVDDDAIHVKLLANRLEEHGFKVVASTEASEGLQIAMKENVDLIILDVMMPIINGFNFCRLLKSQKEKQHIPVIMLTSRDEETDIEIGLEMGADAYLTKPLNMDSLLSTIQTLICNQNDD
jgi:DNA-binding response OmpR family regulator